MDNLMDAAAKMDYARHVRDFSSQIMASYSEEEFKKGIEESRSKWGDTVEREFLGTTKQKGYVTGSSVFPLRKMRR